MNKHLLFAALLGAALHLTGSVQAAPEGETSPFIKDYLGQVDFVEERILALNQAMAAKQGWRPADGVRSVSETYLHIAYTNYFLPKMIGFELPAKVKFEQDMKKWDTQTTDAAKINDMLKASFDHVRSVAKQITPEQMEKEIDLFGHKLTGRNTLIVLLNHMHEHLGQSIAYARMNGVVPPWTAANEAKEKAEPEK